MNVLLKDIVLSEEPCAYLGDRQQKMHYKIIKSCSPALNNELVERGWRRFGQMFFRPECNGCVECLSLKIDVLNYKFSKSERRTIRKNSDIEVVMQKPTLTYEHLTLHKRYHAFMKDKKGWDVKEINFEHYYHSFVSGHGEFGFEMLYKRDGELVGVDYIDILPDGISSIYFFYDQDESKRALGRYSMYRQIILAQERNLPWIYMGYYVEDNSSLNYKTQYRPFKTLKGTPNLHEPFTWE